MLQGLMKEVMVHFDGGVRSQCPFMDTFRLIGHRVVTQ